jgi:drug/metabolite transporter (DMT)-like permease
MLIKTLKRPGRRFAVGTALALASAIAFALNVALVPLAYDAGANVHAVNLVRPLCFALFLLLALALTGTSVRLPASTAATCLMLGVLLGIGTLLLLGAVSYISVGLTILILYTYPILIALFSHAIGADPLDPIRVGIIVGVFTGLAIALQLNPETTSWYGVALAFLSSFTFAALFMLSKRPLAIAGLRVVLLHMMIGATAVMLVIIATLATSHWPTTTLGWTALAASTVTFMAAATLVFGAIRLIGPMQTAIIDNTSPVWGILFGILLLGELITGAQMTGVALVLAGVVAFQVITFRKAGGHLPS